jgi:hypothetical protein
MDAVQCNICFGEPIDQVNTFCDHIFCSTCINTWLAEHNDCPVCRLANPVVDLLDVADIALPVDDPIPLNPPNMSREELEQALNETFAGMAYEIVPQADGTHRVTLHLHGETPWMPDTWQQHYIVNDHDWLDVALMSGDMFGTIVFKNMEPPPFEMYLDCEECAEFLTTEWDLYFHHLIECI